MSNFSQRELLNALQKAQVDAIELITQEMAHHALCWRSIYAIPHYSELLVTQLRPVTNGMDQTERAKLAEGLQWLQINLDSASSEIQHNYASTTRRTVIVLADILENLLQSTLCLCLLHLDPFQTSIKEVTTFKGQISKERDLQSAIKNWERSLSRMLRTRTERIVWMIRAFFPKFQRPDNLEFLDQLFEARNAFTHALIRLDENIPKHSEEPWTLLMVDEGFRVTSEFLLAIMHAIPSDLESPISIKS